MKLRTILATATCLALPLAAHAQIVGPYVSLQGGTSLENPVDYNGTIGGVGGSGRVLYRPSYAGIGGIGYGLGDGFRVELDGDYIHTTTVKQDSDGAGPASHTYGRENKYGPMVNLLYDISLGLPVTPYVGGGVGYQFISTKYYTPTALGATYAGGDKGSFAFDVIAGVAFPVAAVPGLSLTAQYTFLDLTAKYKTGLSVTGGFPPGSAVGGSTKFGPEASHTFTAGVLYALFPPAPPAPPVAPPAAQVPAPPAARTYLVFFDWDKYNLTPRATQIIAQAASDSKTGATTTLDVSGYTDTSGTPVYNQGLSERRAKAVAAQLVTDGVPASEIAIHAYGETHLLVPTGPGVREPQNRRVEIVLQ